MKQSRLLQVAGLVSFLLFLPPVTGRLHSCSCVDPIPAFDETIREVDVGLVGRVLSQGRPDIERVHPLACEVGYLDVEVLSSIKGSESRKRVRVWDASFCTDCSVGLHRFPPGTIVAFALFKNDQRYWKDRGFEPAPDDLLVEACGVYMKRFPSLDDAQAFAERLRTSLSQE